VGYHNPYKDRIVGFDAQAEELVGVLRQAAGQAPEEAEIRSNSPRTRARTLSQSPSAG
jgi:hypothetical protein